MQLSYIASINSIMIYVFRPPTVAIPEDGHSSWPKHVGDYAIYNKKFDIAVYTFVCCITHNALMFCGLSLELYLSNCESSLSSFFIVLVSVSWLVCYGFLCIFLYFSERSIARAVPGVGSFFYLDTKELYKKYLCT
jgi:hypothetical protein